MVFVSHFDTRLAQALGVGDTLVAQWVESAGEDRRGRHAREVRRAKRRSVGVRAVHLASEVVVPEPAHVGLGQQWSIAVLRVRIGVEGVVGNRIEEELVGDVRYILVFMRIPVFVRIFVLCSQCRHSGQISTCAGSTNCDLLWVAAERARVLGDPLDGRVGVVHGGRKRIFWRESVIHGDHDALPAAGQSAADAADGVQRAEDPPAAVVVDQNWRWPVWVVVVDSHWNLSFGTRNREVADELDFRGVPTRKHLVFDSSGRFDAHRGPLRNARRLDFFDDGGHLRMEFRAHATG